jgi:2-polyprenyl-6-methoxyphenol hydroxylase-like FAD-dependent oxidoreductase
MLRKLDPWLSAGMELEPRCFGNIRFPVLLLPQSYKTKIGNCCFSVGLQFERPELRTLVGQNELWGGTVWFANVPRQASTQAERTTTTAEEWKQRLIDLFADDWGPASNLIAGGALELMADNTHDLPSVPTWYKGPMIILGDAAHAPSPTSGQGASIAIEDAVALAKCLRDVPDTSSAFAAFEAMRRHRVERVVAQGARGSSNKAVGPVGRVVRDLLLPLLFRYLVTEKSLAWIYDYHIDWNSPVTMARS